MRAIHRRRLTSLVLFTVTGLGIGAVLGALIQQIDGGALAPHVLRGLVVGTLIGLVIGVGEEVLFVSVGRRLSYPALNASRVVLYAAAMFCSLVLVNSAYPWLVQGTLLRTAFTSYLGAGTLDRDLTFALVAALVGTSLLEVRRLHNPGDLRRFLAGRYRHPEEERRIFLLADLEDSTGIAEQLGNVTYSMLIRDCFYDMSDAILAWRGEVYQYVGDEVIVTWPFEKGVRDAACVRCFFDMVELLEAKTDQHRARYGVAPRFRAGIHGGPVVTTWVGEAKKELAFHGDALNVASRMKSSCRELGATCLVSSDVFRGLPLLPELQARCVGDVPLRGKRDVVKLWSIERRT